MAHCYELPEHSEDSLFLIRDIKLGQFPHFFSDAVFSSALGDVFSIPSVSESSIVFNSTQSLSSSKYYIKT